MAQLSEEELKLKIVRFVYQGNGQKFSLVNMPVIDAAMQSDRCQAILAICRQYAEEREARLLKRLMDSRREGIKL